MALRPTPHDLHVAIDGRQGFELIARLRPQLVFTDVAMPRMNGIELVDALKRQPDLADIPVVLVTASVQRAQIEEGYRHGVAGHLAKPFSPAELLMLLGTFVALEPA